MTGSRRRTRWRELALVGCALLLPVPLLAVGGHLAPLLPSVLERSVASVLPGVTGTSDGASASGSTGASAGAGDGEGGPAASSKVAPDEVGRSFATGTIGVEDSPGSGGAGDDADDAGATGSAEALPTDDHAPSDDNAPSPDEDAPPRSPSDPQAQDPGTSSGPSPAPALQVGGGGSGASVGASAGATGASVSTDPVGGSGEPGGSLGVTSTDGSKTEANTGNEPTSNLPPLP